MFLIKLGGAIAVAGAGDGAGARAREVAAAVIARMVAGAKRRCLGSSLLRREKYWHSSLAPVTMSCAAGTAVGARVVTGVGVRAGGRAEVGASAGGGGGDGDGAVALAAGSYININTVMMPHSPCQKNDVPPKDIAVDCGLNAAVDVGGDVDSSVAGNDAGDGDDRRLGAGDKGDRGNSGIDGGDHAGDDFVGVAEFDADGDNAGIDGVDHAGHEFIGVPDFDDEAGDAEPPPPPDPRGVFKNG